MHLAIVILAAGQGKRFKSQRPKILHALAGRPLVWHALETARALRAARTVVVVSPEVEQPMRALIAEHRLHAVTAIQRTPNGTAGAVKAAQRALKDFSGYVLIMCGDVPLLRRETLQRMIRDVATQQAPGGVLTVELTDPTGYGRIVRGIDGRVYAITEERDADTATRAIQEINTGVMCCDARWLFSALKQIHAQNAQREYYLTDLAAVAAVQGNAFVPILVPDATECRGINSRAELAAAEAEVRRRLVKRWMDAGVTFRDPTAVYIDTTVTIGSDTFIEPNVTLQGATVIGPGCVIGQGSVIINTRLGRNVRVHPYSVIDSAQASDHVEIGPFARLRPGARLDREVRVGNFVEIKKSWLKQGAKANHLTYLGDATIGKATNVGCGTITCNYDGRKKHATIIGDHVFIGSDTQFVAPVRVGRGAVTAAGSVITEDVPPRSLAVARGRQVVKRDWAAQRTRKRKS